MHVKIFWLKRALEHILAAKSQDLLIKVSNTDGIITAHKIMTIISLHTKILHEIPLQTRGTGQFLYKHIQYSNGFNMECLCNSRLVEFNQISPTFVLAIV